MKKPPIPKPITILVLTLMTAFVWVGLSIYRGITVKPRATVPETISKPLDPKLDTDVIQKIESAVFFSDAEIPQILIEVPTTQPTPTETPSPSPESEASGSATLAPEASASATPAATSI